MKKGLSKAKRFILILLSSILIAATFLLIYFFLEDSVMLIDYGYNYEVSYFIPFFERDNTTYEESDLFDGLFESSVDEIVRMAVIKNQMETDGKYDADKRIDISAYANRNKVVHSTEIAAEYRLDDLIKWGIKGIEYEILSAESIPFDVPGDTIQVVKPRYKSADGKDLLTYANSVAEYNILVENLKTTCNALVSNYKEYISFGDKYGVGKTNIQYCVQMYNDGKLVRFTNMDIISTNQTTDDITGLFKKQIKYLYYNPDKVTLVTNSSITAMQMQNTVSSYSYSFSDNSRIWIGFDSTYSAEDGFKEAKGIYDSKTAETDGIVLIAAIWVTFFAYLSLFVFLIIKEGRRYYRKNEEIDGDDCVVLKKIDSMPVEFLVVIAFGVVIFDLLLAGYTFNYVYDNVLQSVVNYIIIVAVMIVLNQTFMPTVLCFVRRAKAHNFSENSCFVWVINNIRKGTIDAYDNGHAIIRTWIPYIIFLLINLILMLFGRVGLVIAFVLDMCIGGFLYKNNKERQEIIKSINIISQSDVKHQVDTNKMHGDNLQLANAVNNIGNGIRKAVEKSMKDEKMKADLITNVSHDIKTPLTSIINYVDLLKRENIQDEKVSGYIDVLDQKSQRLKQLTDDLVEASKISSGNIVLNFERINIVELVYQSIGEFEDKFGEHGLKCRFDPPEKPIYISADSRSMFRIIENLYNNIYKYALQGTRVYIDLQECGVEGATRVQLSVKNISESQLNMSADELLERFKQGDESRKTEGSGLGLSITKSLTEAMNGQFDLLLDGDLFKVILTFNTIA